MSVDLKTCCADAYSSEAAHWLLGDSFHPGGAELTSRLVAALAVGPGQVVVDVASGLGTSAVQLARETGCDVVGVDLSRDNVAKARRALDWRVRFVEGDAEALPFVDANFDGALCECTLCTFPDAPAAAAEIARVLRPGARLALSDVTAEPQRLPGELRTVLARVACIAGARPLEQIGALLKETGFVVETLERHDAALDALLECVDARLQLAHVADVFAEGVGRGRQLVAAARAAMADGVLGYGVAIAVKP